MKRAQLLNWLLPKTGLSAYRKAETNSSEAWNILLKDSEQAVPTDPCNYASDTESTEHLSIAFSGWSN